MDQQAVPNLVLANIDYEAHTTDEGLQLQRGLEAAGWTLAGKGYGDGCRHVPDLLARYKPDRVFVQDVRDWYSRSNISFRKDLDFTGLEALRDVPTFTVLKDAWGWHAEQAWLAETCGVRGIANYYAADVVRREAPWCNRYPLHRIYHTIDSEWCDSLWHTHRQRACVTGARSPVYPMRMLAIRHAAELGLATRPHPGYGNHGADTPAYLAYLANYRVHVACGSKWRVAFRKIVESVAMGCTPITTLDPADVLPEIDGALVRVAPDATVADLRNAITAAAEAWDADERRHWAERAWAYYDWQTAGLRLANTLEAA